MVVIASGAVAIRSKRVAQREIYWAWNETQSYWCRPRISTKCSSISIKQGEGIPCRILSWCITCFGLCHSITSKKIRGDTICQMSWLTWHVAKRCAIKFDVYGSHNTCNKKKLISHIGANCFKGNLMHKYFTWYCV